jgi:hypothetical protein
MEILAGVSTMPEPTGPDPDQLARQGQQHLSSLRAAGVEWLPLFAGEPSPVVGMPAAGRTKMPRACRSSARPASF